MRHENSLQVVTLPLSELVPDPDNPRLHSERNLAAIRVSLETHGQVAPLVVQRDGLTIIGGNATAASLMALGRTDADVVLIDCDDDERKALAVRLNRTAELADWDSVVLGEFLANADDGGAFGFDQGEVDAFVRDLEGTADDWPDARPTLAERFGIPPFSVIDTRRGRWPARKRAWIAMGIESEIGRDGGAIYKSLSGQVPNYYYQKTEAEAEVGRTLSHSEFQEKHLVTSDGSGISAGGTSVFDPVLTEILIRWYSGKGGTILDPFAGGSVRGVVAAALGRKYTGVELRPEQVEANRVQWGSIMERLDSIPEDDVTQDMGTKIDRQSGADTEANPAPTWIEGDSSEVVPTLIDPNGAKGFDMVLSCPPYFDLEVYSDDERDLSGMKWDEFLVMYRSIIAATVAKLANNRFICWVVSDVRDKDGNYRGLIRHTIDAFEVEGANLYNEATLVTSTGSAAIRAPRAFEQSRKLARIHQVVLVFVKGDPRTATEVCGPVEAVGFDHLQPDEEYADA